FHDLAYGDLFRDRQFRRRLRGSRRGIGLFLFRLLLFRLLGLDFGRLDLGLRFHDFLHRGFLLGLRVVLLGVLLLRLLDVLGLVRIFLLFFLLGRLSSGTNSISGGAPTPRTWFCT